MPISIACPNCAKALTLGDDVAGKIIVCPSCDEAFEASPQEPPAKPLVMPRPEPSAITKNPPPPPKKKAVWDDDEPPAKSRKAASKDVEADEMYGFDADDDEEREDRRRTREVKEKRRRHREERQREESYQPHQGILILVLGILSVLGACMCAVIGWGFAPVVIGMANTDLAKMDNRVMDPRGREMTVAGKACAIIAVGVGLVNCIFGIAINLRRFH